MTQSRTRKKKSLHQEMDEAMAAKEAAESEGAAAACEPAGDGAAAPEDVPSPHPESAGERRPAAGAARPEEAGAAGEAPIGDGKSTDAVPVDEPADAPRDEGRLPDGAFIKAPLPPGVTEVLTELPIESLRPHPLLRSMPRMRRHERDAFREDVRLHGLHDPITVQRGGEYLDGQERVQAARAAGHASVRCRVVDLTPEQIEAYVLRAAAMRRNLNDDQQAVLAARLHRLLADETNRRRAEKAGKAGGRGRAKEADSSEVDVASELSTDPADGGAKERARSAAARQRGISEAKLKDAVWLLKQSEELAEKVQTGEMRLSRARHEAAEEKKKNREGPLQHEPAKGTWSIRVGDCLDVLPALPNGAARLIFAEPPPIVAEDGTAAMGGAPVVASWEDWLRLCVERLTADGSLWLLVNNDAAADMGSVLRRVGLHTRALITVFNRHGEFRPHNFQARSRHLFYAVKDPHHFVFHDKTLTKGAAGLAGCIGDVWEIAALEDDDTERLAGFPSQQPLDLLRPVVLVASRPGDLILDPFSGSATAGVAAVEAGRNFIGVEKDAEIAELSRERLRTVGAPEAEAGTKAKESST